MKTQILLFFLLNCLGALSQHKSISLDCRVLGKMDENVRYYHPIQGEYEIELKNYPKPSKKEIKTLRQYVFIEPQKHLKDSNNFIQANSLRHQANLNELVYINWEIGFDSLNNQSKVDSFVNAACYRRDQHYSDIVQDYFQPFLISKYEVTNAEYREFVEWVKDSIFREALYMHPDISDETAIQFLAIEKTDRMYFSEEEMDWIELDPSDRITNRALFQLNFNFDWQKKIPAETYVPIISEFYLRANERWYKRRELDTRKLVYKYYTVDLVGAAVKEIRVNDSIVYSNQQAIRSHPEKARFIIEHEIPIYPDTLCWDKMKWFPYNEPITNMYFWHPAYDNYPVVGLSYTQIQAYLHWKQNQLEHEYPELMEHYELAIPNPQEIEWTINSTLPQHASRYTSDQEVITNLMLGLPSDDDATFHEAYLRGEMPYTHKVFEASQQIQKPAKIPESIRAILKMRLENNQLNNQVEFLSGNVSEWIESSYENYQKVLDAYVNYNCFADIDYCQYQRPLDANQIAKNSKEGMLIMGSNWYDERYNDVFTINTEGTFAKRFAHVDSSFSTVGFRTVLRLKP